MEKIGKLLSDEESMKQLSELAQLLMNETKSSESEKDSDNTENSECNENGDGSFPDISSIMKIAQLMGTFSQNDKNTNLLLALRPHLKEERQQKVDKAIKLLKIMTVWSTAKETGLLNDIL